MLSPPSLPDLFHDITEVTVIHYYSFTSSPSQSPRSSRVLNAHSWSQNLLLMFPEYSVKAELLCLKRNFCAITPYTYCSVRNTRNKIREIMSRNSLREVQAAMKCIFLAANRVSRNCLHLFTGLDSSPFKPNGALDQARKVQLWHS